MTDKQGIGNGSIRVSIKVAVLAVGLAFAFQTSFAQIAPTQVPVAQNSDAGTVVRSLVEAMNQNDGVRIRALFAPQASQAYGDGRPKSGPTFFAWLESDIIERKGQVDDAKFMENGSEVIITGQFRNSRGYRSAANFRLVVEQGRIVSWQMRY